MRILLLSQFYPPVIGGEERHVRNLGAALAVLEPLYRGENALEPERVSEKLHQNSFWLGQPLAHIERYTR